MMNDKTTILVVDDNEDLLETFAMILKRRGYEVQTACDGVDAVDKFKEQNFDVTLMDVVMPEMNGVDAFKKMREIQPEASIILMTAYSDEELMQTAKEEGVHLIIQKPIRIDKLIEMINETAGNQPILIANDNTILQTLQSRQMVRK
jgi:CheY-like chemotaxis protein